MVGTGARYLYKRLVLALVNALAPPRYLPPVDRVRTALLRAIGFRVDPTTFVSAAFFVFDGRNVRMGGNGNIGAFSRIWDFSPVTIGDNLLCSHNLTIVAGTHDTARPYAARPGPVTIGDDVWIGVDVTIVGPCRIADGVVIGARSFVTGDLDAPGIYAGTPARFKRALSGDPITPPA